MNLQIGTDFQRLLIETEIFSTLTRELNKFIFRSIVKWSLKSIELRAVIFILICYQY